jgi:peptide chain release factor 1
MNVNIQAKLTKIVERYNELITLLSDARILSDQNRYRDLTKESSQLTPIIDAFQKYQKLLNDQKDLEELMKDSDHEMSQLAKQDLEKNQKSLEELEQQLYHLLLPQDPDDTKNVFVEIRAGAGGDEAAIFAGDLFRLYTRYAEKKNWSVDIVSQHEGERGGYKEIIARFIGKNAYSKLKFESGVHRVQRVPETEAQGRVHTSTCTVAVLPEVEEVDHIDIKPDDLRIDTFRSSGAGGQSVNKTESAIRITHIPSGLVVECQEERSQHQNKARAMSILQAKLLKMVRDKQENAEAEARRHMVGTGDRSERIRTYNFPQNRVTDHRISLTLYQLSKLMEGELDMMIEPLSMANETELLTSSS